MVILQTIMPSIPDSCMECDFFCSGRCVGKQIIFGKEDREWLKETRPNWCPLKETEDANKH